MDTTYIYTKPSCSSSRKAILFFSEHNIPYREIKLQHQTIDQNHLHQAMLASEDGFEGLIKRTALIDLMELKTEQAKAYILENPLVLRTPVVIQGKKALSGYSEEEFGMFQSREKRKRDLKHFLSAV